ncbi:MAG: neuromedin U [Longimicrobiales bacterium]
MKASRSAGLLVLTGVLMASPVRAQEADLAKQTQNPVGDLISIPLQNNFNGGFGEDDAVFYNLNIQPVYPAGLSEDWSLINRAIIPILDAPAPVDAGGLGDIQYQWYLTPAQPGAFVWGVGAVVQLPTATDAALGSDKWSVGPGVVGLSVSGPWVVGAVLNNIWSIAGNADRSDVNQMLLQVFVNYNLPSGLYLTSSPVITSNWEAPSGQRWTVPVGGGVGKILRLGKLPLNTQLQFYYNLEAPDIGPDWQTRFQVQFLFPK